MSKMGHKLQEELDYISYQQLSDKRFNEVQLRKTSECIKAAVDEENTNQQENLMRKLMGRDKKCVTNNVLEACRKILGC